MAILAQSAARAAETRELVEKLLPGFVGNVVLDADGLNAAASLLNAGRLFPHPAGELVVTPHPGEMSRLTGLSASALAADRAGLACRFAREWDAVVVLKGRGHRCRRAGRPLRPQHDGQPRPSQGRQRRCAGRDARRRCWPAVSRGMTPPACAVWLHGAAADRAAALRGEAGMLPHDLFSPLGQLFAENRR